MSIGELANMYRDGEIDIHPEFQRFFRWSPIQKSRLIESLLLGIPIPSIFVAQRADGVWDVIDGLQRLSTILQFMGILRGEDENLIDALQLKKTDYLPSLEGMNWDNIGTENQLIVKRAKLDIKIMLRESDANSKYELFQRLNTGGSELSEQETRNCIMIMYKPEFYRWVEKLSRNSDFKEAVAITENAYEKRYDMELVTRFLVFRQIEDVSQHDLSSIGDFITKKVIDMIESPSYNKEEEEKIFESTFALINRQLGSNAFKRYYPESDQFKGSFSVATYEAITYAMGRNYDLYSKSTKPIDLKKSIRELWQDSAFNTKIGSGSNAGYRIPHTLPKALTIFKP